MAIAEMYTRSYLEDMRALNVIPPDIQPRAAGHILHGSDRLRQVNLQSAKDVKLQADLESQQEGERRLDQSLLELVATSFIAGFTIVFGMAALSLAHAAERRGK